MKPKKERRFPIRVKTTLMIVIFGLVLMGIAMVYFSIVVSNNNKKSYKSLATDLSNSIALSVDINKVKNVTNAVVAIYDEYEEKPTREKEGTAEYEAYLAKFDVVRQSQDYKDIQKYLKNIKDVNTDTNAIYLGYVDYDNKLTVYLVYDEENELYPIGVIDPLYEEDYPVIENHKLGFVASIYQAEVEGITLVTAGAPVVDENDQVICYALVDITMATVRSKQNSSIIRLFVYLISTVVILSIIGVVVINFTLVKPVKILQGAAKSYDVNDPERTHAIFSSLKVNVHDEFSDLADNMRNMENDINNKISELTLMNKELVQSQLEARRMSELANKDALTGVRNKAAYDEEVKKIDERIASKEDIKFGIAMVDLNYLKSINDDYGHNSGDSALIKLCNIICAIFAHSPVFRIGGDEFVIILKGKDYHKANKLIDEFNAKIDELNEDDELLPAEKASAAIGYSKFNPKSDTCVEDVFKRADQLMYARKREMKEDKK